MMQKNKSSRRVHLYCKYRESQAAGYCRPPGKWVPWLNISGLWLERAGFHIGDQVEITVKDNLLMIKNLKRSKKC
jgi:toxic protein SymE